MHRQLYFKHLCFRPLNITWTVVHDLAETAGNNVIQFLLCCWSVLVISHDKKVKVQQILQAFQETVKVADVTVKSVCFVFWWWCGVFLSVLFFFCMTIKLGTIKRITNSITYHSFLCSWIGINFNIFLSYLFHVLFSSYFAKWSECLIWVFILNLRFGFIPYFFLAFIFSFLLKIFLCNKLTVWAECLLLYTSYNIQLYSKNFLAFLFVSSSFWKDRSTGILKRLFTYIYLKFIPVHVPTCDCGTKINYWHRNINGQWIRKRKENT